MGLRLRPVGRRRQKFDFVFHMSLMDMMCNECCVACTWIGFNMDGYTVYGHCLTSWVLFLCVLLFSWVL